MIINATPKNLAEHNLAGRVKEFTMQSNAKSFKILSSKLYADKIRAVIRELSTNAVDSHIEAGNPQPFEVHLPTYLEPYFHVRDFGIGMDEETVESVYTTYFDSTKNNTNLLNGGLGLGSKAPFAYTDTFTITAIKNGIKLVYSAFISDNGTPSVIKMSEMSSNEPTGMCITIPVKSEDFSRFKQTAISVFESFEQPPIETSGYQFEKFTLGEEIVPGLFSMDRHFGNRVRMANVVYPIESKFFPSRIKNVIDHTSFLIDVPNGSLEFQPSREGLEYTKETVSVISSYIEKVIAQVTSKFDEDLKDCKNLWEKADKVKEWYNDRVYLYFVDGYINTRPDLKGRVRYHGLHNISVSDVEKTAFASNIEVLSLICHEYSDRTVLTQSHVMVLGGDIVFVYQKGKVGIKERVKRHFRLEGNANDNKNIIILTPIDRTKPMEIDKFFEFLGNPPKNLIMTEDDIPVTEVKKSDRITLKNLLFWSTTFQQLHPFKEQIDLNTMMYVRFNGMVPDEKVYGHISASNRELFTALSKILPNTKFIAIRRKDAENIPDGMKDAILEAKSFLELQPDSWYDALAYKPTPNRYEFSRIQHLTVDQSSPLSKFLGVCHPFYYSEIEPIVRKLVPNKVDGVHSKYQYKLSELQRVLKRYPLFDSSMSKKEAVEQYIRLIDKEYP